MVEVTLSSRVSTRVDECGLFQKGGIVDESRAVLMRRETTLLSTRKEDRGSGIGRSTHSPRGITSRVSSERHKRRATTMTGYHKHHIQTPRIYTYAGSAQERMEKKHATPRYHSAQASAQMCSTPGQLSDDTAFQSKDPNAERLASYIMHRCSTKGRL